MPKKFGYARVSTTDQSLAIQEAKLNAVGCAVVFAEKASGASAGRPELARVLAVLAKATPSSSPALIASAVRAAICRTSSPPSTKEAIDTRGASGKLFVDVLAAVAEFETTLRKDRQSEGITAAKANGK